MATASDPQRTEHWAQLLRGITYDYGAGKIIGDLRIADLAHALAGINRYNAWTPIYWSVASHACLVAETLAALGSSDYATILVGLHHDDHESIVGDALHPFKMAMSESMRAEYRHHAQKADRAIWRALGIWPLVQISDDESRATVVKAADLAALEAERRWLMTPRMKWSTEDIVNPRMLEVAERIMAGDLCRIPGGPPAAERFVMRHNALVERMGVA